MLHPHSPMYFRESKILSERRRNNFQLSVDKFLNKHLYKKKMIRIKKKQNKKEEEKDELTTREEQIETEPLGGMAWILVTLPLKLEEKLMTAFFLGLATFAAEAFGQRTNFDVAICTETESIGAQ